MRKEERKLKMEEGVSEKSRREMHREESGKCFWESRKSFLLLASCRCRKVMREKVRKEERKLKMEEGVSEKSRREMHRRESRKCFWESRKLVFAPGKLRMQKSHERKSEEGKKKAKDGRRGF